MKHLRTYKDFNENATCNASTTAGMGSVVAAQPGAFPGTAGTTGSGDVSNVLGGPSTKIPVAAFNGKKRKKRKGGANEVSDLRDLN